MALAAGPDLHARRRITLFEGQPEALYWSQRRHSAEPPFLIQALAGVDQLVVGHDLVDEAHVAGPINPLNLLAL